MEELKLPNPEPPGTDAEPDPEPEPGQDPGLILKTDPEPEPGQDPDLIPKTDPDPEPAPAMRGSIGEIPRCDREGMLCRDRWTGMRKRLITPSSGNVPSRGEGWLDLASTAVAEVTSEEPDYPVESALVFGELQGWRAAMSGAQTIRLIFDQPQSLKRISLVFEEQEAARTQEFVLRWSPDSGKSFREIVRQQWNFSPESKREVEEYRVRLSNVTVLELTIMPSVSGGAACASLKSLSLA